jgi:hypothetical protein
MSSDFIAKPLSAAQVMQAYPLVQALDDRLSPESWNDFATMAVTSNSSPCGRIMTLQTAGGYIHALFVYRINQDLLDGRRLDVDHLVAFELPGQATAVRAALRIVEQIGRENDCTYVVVALPTRQETNGQAGTPAAATLDSAGYQIGPGLWRKHLS